MSSIVISVFLILVLALPAIGGEDNHKGVSDSVRIERLAGICELWGMINYFHPFPAYRDIDWNRALEMTVSRVNKAETAQEYKQAVDYMLSFLHDPNTYVRDPEYRIDPARVSDVDDYQPYLVWTEDSIAVIVANNYGSFAFHPDKFFIMEDIVARAATARGVIIDVRQLDIPTKKGPFSFHMILDVLLEKYLPDLLKNPINIPSTRSLYYPRDPHAITGFRHPWHIRHFDYRSGYEVEGRYPGRNRLPIVFVMNEGSEVLQPLVIALQESNQAEVLYEGPFWKELAVETYTFELPDNIIVEVRTDEMVRSDGSAATHPDLVIPYVTDTSLLDCPPIIMAMEIINGTRETPPAMADFLPTCRPRKFDSTYFEEGLPSTESRILAVSILWNTLKYFYPYFEDIEPSPKKLLSDFIVRMEEGGNRLKYVTTLAKMAARLNDSNAEIEATDFSEFLGKFRPHFEAKFVEGKTVVNRIAGYPEKYIPELDPGDIIISIDDENIDERRARLRQYFSASTPQAMETKINEHILNGDHSSNMHLVVEKAVGDTVEVTTGRSVIYPALSENRCAVEILDDNIGYIDVDRVDIPWYLDTDIASSFKDILTGDVNTHALIVDMRGHDIGLDWNVLRHLVKEVTIGSRSHIPGRYSPDCSAASWTISDDKLAPSDDGLFYKKGLAVLIDETTINGGEWYCMFLESGADATFIGTPTNGAVGGDSQLTLPGNIKFNYTRAKVEYPDGRKVHGVGIQPDIYVEPTIEGIREGRDEILESALDYLKNSSK